MPPTVPIISVVIPTYNYAHVLPRALESVFEQMDDRIELLVIDDGSTDATATVLADYQVKHPALNVIHQTNSGAASARNVGIRRACGKYVLLLDADDELLPGALAALLTAQERATDAGIFLGGYISVKPDGRESLRLPRAIPSADVRSLIKLYLLEGKISIQHSCSMFRRDMLLATPYPDHLTKSEDIPVFASLLISAPVVTIDQAFAKIHKHPNSLRNSRANEEANELSMAQCLFDRLPTECQSLRKQYFAQRYLSLSRRALNDNDFMAARRYYRRAFSLSLSQSMRWTYLRKVLRLFVSH